MAAPKKPEEEKAIKQTISIRPDQFHEIVALCQKIDRPISYVIRRALDEFLERHKDDKPVEDPFFKW